MIHHDGSSVLLRRESSTDISFAQQRLNTAAYSSRNKTERIIVDILSLSLFEAHRDRSPLRPSRDHAFAARRRIEHEYLIRLAALIDGECVCIDIFLLALFVKLQTYTFIDYLHIQTHTRSQMKKKKKKKEEETKEGEQKRNSIDVRLCICICNTIVSRQRVARARRIQMSIPIRKTKTRSGFFFYEN